jgi:hypothetical protein
MRLQSRLLFLVVAIAFSLSLIALPTSNAEAQGRQITITITEAQFSKYMNSVRPRNSKSASVDIIDGGVIVKIQTRWTDLPEYHEHYGILIKEGKIVTEFGVIDIPGVGALGYEDLKNLIPELVPFADYNAKILDKYVQRQIRAKAGTRYTPESVTTGNDQVVIVVRR